MTSRLDTSAAVHHGSLNSSPFPWQHLRLGRSSFRFRVRHVVVALVLLVAIFCLLVVQLTTGEYPLGFGDAVRTLFGQSTPDREYIVETLRLPRALAAIIVGASLGLSGAVFQSITRNPLGSPDILGFTQGAAVGAVIQILVFNGDQAAIALSAIGGGAVVAILVYGLSYRGGVQGYRMILVGIGLTAIMGSFVAYLLIKADVRKAQSALVWLTGSLNGSVWTQVVPVIVAFVVLAPITIAMDRHLKVLGMGDELARGLGLSVEKARLGLLLVGTTLCAVAVSAAGPIAFVALAAPQIARRLSGGAGIGMGTSILTGAVILQVSDIAAQQLFAPIQVPVGVMTLAVGGAYLCWLLFRENRAGRG